MMVSYRYRLLPTKRQHHALEQILESQRQLYNAALEERIDAYRKAGVTRTYFDQSFPRFRGKGWFDSFGFREFEGITLGAARLRFKGMPGSLRVHLHRELPAGASIRSCTFKRGTKGWSVSFAATIKAAAPRETHRAVGVDLGITTFAALADGGFIPSLKAARRAERRLRVAQRALARKKRGSGRRREARMAVARCHAAVARQRTEHLHQASARLIRDYDVIAIEKLNVKGLASSALAKDVHDASWARFISMLRYKAEKAGARLNEVDPRNTSQECSDCGTIVPKDLAERRHDCPHCGLSIDRDLNAACNILNRAGVGPGLHNVAGCGMRAGENLDLAQWTPQESVASN